jgi:hypothetical protein
MDIMVNYMSYGFDNNHGATEIGLTSLGCLSVDGTPRCPRYQKDCDVPCTTKCMVTSTHATSLAEMHIALASFEHAIQATCI